MKESDRKVSPGSVRTKDIQEVFPEERHSGGVPGDGQGGDIVWKEAQRSGT